MQDNAAQQCWYSAIMVANSTTNTDKLVKIVHPHFFGEDGCSNLHQSLRKLVIAGDEDTCDQSDNHPLHPFHYTQPIIITFIAYGQPLPIPHGMVIPHQIRDTPLMIFRFKPR